MELEAPVGTAIIMERMLPDEVLTLDDVFKLMTVYYWWTDRWQEPECYLEDVIDDLPEERLLELMEALHQSDVSRCTDWEDSTPCSLSTEHCFGNYQEAMNEDEPEPEPFRALVEDWVDNVIDDYEDSPFQAAYRRYVTDSLAANGATDLEIGNALEVLELEADRRQLASSDLIEDYTEFREAGGSFEEFIGKPLLNHLMGNPGTVEIILADQEDLTEEVKTMSKKEKRAVVTRSVEEGIDFYSLLEVSYQKYQHGVLPAYISRFSD